MRLNLIDHLETWRFCAVAVWSSVKEAERSEKRCFSPDPPSQAQTFFRPFAPSACKVGVGTGSFAFGCDGFWNHLSIVYRVCFWAFHEQLLWRLIECMNSCCLDQRPTQTFAFMFCWCCQQHIERVSPYEKLDHIDRVKELRYITERVLSIWKCSEGPAWFS